MNEKPMTHDQLEACFQKYDKLENINKISFLGKITKPNRKEGIDNPKFHEVRDRDGGIYDTARIMLDFPSPFRIQGDGRNYISKIPVFTTGNVASVIKEQLDTTETKYLCGTGRVQDYRVHDTHCYYPELVELVDDIADRAEINDELKKKVFHILKCTQDPANPTETITMKTIWSDAMSDGNAYAKHMIDNGELPQKNVVELQGIVYMPPSIRQQLADGTFMLHLKLRVKRPKQSLPVPSLFYSKIDYINVLGFGDNASRWFEQIRQGDPVHVQGRLESEQFKYRMTFSKKQAHALTPILGDDPVYIRELEQWFAKNSRALYRTHPTYNVWANEIKYVG